MTLKNFHILQIMPLILGIIFGLILGVNERVYGVICFFSLTLSGAILSQFLFKRPAKCDLCSHNSKFGYDYYKGRSTPRVVNICPRCGPLINTGILKIKIKKFNP